MAATPSYLNGLGTGAVMKSTTYAFTINLIRAFVAAFVVQMAAAGNVYTKQAIIAAIIAGALAALSLTPSNQSS